MKFCSLISLIHHLRISFTAAKKYAVLPEMWGAAAPPSHSLMGVQSSTPGKNCKQNIVADLNDIINVRLVVKGEDKYSESLDKPGKQHTFINHTKIKKKN